MAPGEPDARRRNEQLVSQLETSGTLRDPAVAAAFRAVLRHRFLPGRPLDDVYEDSAIMTKLGEHGTAVSSSSQPAIMAIMLQLLRLRPGDRVLEIGAGTAYNAAIMARLVAPGGRVVTLDVDQDLVEQARANLARAGVEGVEVVLADGFLGWPGGAPYDRMIVTASVDDLSPWWLAQLVEDGRLVVPLVLAGPGQQCAAFVRHGRALTGSELCACGFVPLRGEMAPVPPAPDHDLAAWAAEPGRPAGYAVPARDLRAGFETWLALTRNDYVSPRLRPDEPPTFGLRDDRGAALLAGEGDDRAVLVFRDGERAAERLAEAHRSWSLQRPPMERLAIEARPAGEEPFTGEDVRILRRRRFTFVVRQV